MSLVSGLDVLAGGSVRLTVISGEASLPGGHYDSGLRTRFVYKSAGEAPEGDTVEGIDEK